MKTILTIAVSVSVFLLLSCSQEKEAKVSEIDLRQSTEGELSEREGVEKTQTKPNTVLLTGFPEHRLITIYKEKFTKNGKSYVEGNFFHHNYNEPSDSNAWHYHYMPGIEAVYGYNMYNIVHYNMNTGEMKYFFDSLILVKTLYYPAFVQDTLNGKPVKRDYYLVSVYDEDTNNDSIINTKDLRRLYHFDIGCTTKTRLVPLSYSVVGSQYDPDNDVMYIYAKFDENGNGIRDREEPFHVFLISLKSPGEAVRVY